MKHLLLIALSLISFLSQAQQIVWEQIWGDTNTYMGHEILLTKRNTVIVNALNDDTPPSVYYPVTFLEYDLNGNLLYVKPGSKVASGEEDLIELPDSSLLFAGCRLEQGSPALNDSETFLQKLNSNRDTLWRISYPSPGNLDLTTQLLLLDSGNVLMAGMGRRLVWPYLSYFNLRKTDSLGNQIWYREFAPNPNAYGSRILRNKRGNFVMVGVSDRLSPLGQSVFHPFLLEVSEQGDSIRSKAIIVRSSGEDEQINRAYNNILETKDGNYIVSGFYLDSGAYEMGFILKLDTAFNVNWKYVYRPSGIYSALFKVHELSDSSLLILTIEQGSSSFGVIKLSADGKLVGKKVFTSSVCNNLFPFDWEVLNDTSFVMTGRCNSAGLAYTVKVDFPQILGTEESVINPQKQQLGLAYPNPATQQVTIPFTLPAASKSAQLSIIDVVNGRTVRSLPVSGTSVTLELHGLSSGVYAYTLSLDGCTVATQKLTVIR